MKLLKIGKTTINMTSGLVKGYYKDQKILVGHVGRSYHIGLGYPKALKVYRSPKSWFGWRVRKG